MEEYGWAPPTSFGQLMHLILAREAFDTKNNNHVVDVCLPSNGLKRAHRQEMPDGLVCKPWAHNLPDFLSWVKVGFLGFGGLNCPIPGQLDRAGVAKRIFSSFTLDLIIL